MTTKMDKEARSLTVTLESIDAFLNFMKSNGAGTGTIRTYRAYLRSFLNFLPEGKRVSKGSLRRWLNAMRREGVNDKAVKSRISTVNRYLLFYHMDALCLYSQQRRNDENDLSEMSREEYLRLLRTAWNQGKVKNYLIVKTLCVTGIGVSDLAKITVNDVNEGKIEVGTGFDKNIVSFPMSLRREMQNYAQRENLTGDDLLLITMNGTPLTDRTILQIMRCLAGRAGVRQKIATPRHLRLLYRKTHNEIQNLINAQAEQMYENLLESELLSVRSSRESV